MSVQGIPDRARRGADMVIGAVLVALGILFFAAQFLNIDLGQLLWPFFIIVPGLAFFVAMVLVGKNGGGLAIPGSIITMVGLILLYQNTFNHWQSWAYAWALIPTSVGIGLIIHGIWADNPRIRENGMRLTRVGIILFAIFGAFFELVLNISGFSILGRWFWPLLLIGLGALMLMWRVFGQGDGEFAGPRSPEQVTSDDTSKTGSTEENKQ